MVDLTTLEGVDTPGKVRDRRQGPPARPGPPGGAARRRPMRVSDLVAVACLELLGSGVKVASDGHRCSRRDARRWRSSGPLGPRGRGGRRRGSTLLIDRGAFLAGRYGWSPRRSGPSATPAGLARPQGDPGAGSWPPWTTWPWASWLAMPSGVHFIKTSTGKVSPAATRRSPWSCWAPWPTRGGQGTRVGVKVAGGTNRQGRGPLPGAGQETAGPDWLTPALFRIGASSLLNDLLMQRRKQLTGVYPSPTTSPSTDPGRSAQVHASADPTPSTGSYTHC